MKPIPFSMKGTEYALTLKVSTYPEGNLAIKLYQDSWYSGTASRSIWAACVPKIVDISISGPLANAFTPGLSAMAWGNAPDRFDWRTA